MECFCNIPEKVRSGCETVSRVLVEEFEVHASPDTRTLSLIPVRSHTEMRTLLSESGGKTIHKMPENLAELCSGVLGKVEFASDEIIYLAGTCLNKLL